MIKSMKVMDGVIDFVLSHVTVRVGYLIKIRIWDRMRSDISSQVGSLVRDYVWDQIGDRGGR